MLPLKTAILLRRRFTNAVFAIWFCDLHRKPKLPYFVDWETRFDVQGNPEVKALNMVGHADFV